MLSWLIRSPLRRHLEVGRASGRDEKLACRLRDGLPTKTAYRNQRSVKTDDWLTYINLSDGAGCQ
jgi:hypothetical protein